MKKAELRRQIEDLRVERQKDREAARTAAEDREIEIIKSGYIPVEQLRGMISQYSIERSSEIGFLFDGSFSPEPPRYVRTSLSMRAELTTPVHYAILDTIRDVS